MDDVTTNTLEPLDEEQVADVGQPGARKRVHVPRRNDQSSRDSQNEASSLGYICRHQIEQHHQGAAFAGPNPRKERASAQDVGRDGIMVQLYSNPVSDRREIANFVELPLHSNRDAKQQRQHAFFSNKYDMLDQFSRLNQVQSGRPESGKTEEELVADSDHNHGEPGQDDYQVNRNSKQQAHALRAVQQKTGDASAAPQAPLNDLTEVLDVRLESRGTQRADLPLELHSVHSSFENYGGFATSGFPKQLAFANHNHVYAACAGEGEKPRKLHRKLREKSATVGRSAQRSGANSESTAYNASYLRQQAQQSRVSTAKTFHRIHAGFRTRKGLKQMQQAAAARPAVNLNIRVRSSLGDGQRRVLDLNEQVIANDASGVFRQSRGGSPHVMQSRFEKPRKLINKGGTSESMQVRIELTRGQGHENRRGVPMKSALRQQVSAGKHGGVKVRKEKNAALAKTEAQAAISVRDSNSVNLPSTALREKKSLYVASISRKDYESDNVAHQSVSSFHTVGLQAKSAERPARGTCSHKADHRRCASSASPAKDAEPGASRSNERIKVEIPAPQQRPDFVVQGFQNVLKSKAQRESRRSVTSKPYQEQEEGSRRQKIVLEQAEKPVDGESSGSPTRENSVQRWESAQDGQGIDVGSPALIKRESELTEYRLDTAMKYSTQKRPESSVELTGNSPDPILDVFTTAPRDDKPEQPGIYVLPAAIETVKDGASRDADNESTRRIEQSCRVLSESEIPPQTGSQQLDTLEVAAPAEPELLPKPLTKLEPNVLKERLAIFKRDLQVKRRLKDTRDLVEQNETQSQSSFAVRNVQLRPRQIKSGQKLDTVDTMVAADEKTAPPYGEVSLAQNQPTRTEKIKRKNLSMSYLRCRQKRQVLRKRIEATQKFNEEFNEPILIRPPSVNIRGAPQQPRPQSTLVKMKSLRPKPAVAADEAFKDPGDNKTSEFITVDSLRRIMVQQKADPGEQTGDNFVSVYSSQIHSSRPASKHINLATMEPGQQRTSHQALAQKVIEPSDMQVQKGTLKGRRGQAKLQNSTPYLRKRPESTAQSSEHALSRPGFLPPRSALPRRIREHSATLPHKLNKMSKTGGQSLQQRQFQQFASQARTSEYTTDQQSNDNRTLEAAREYNMSQQEKDRIKAKNIQLIAQFQTTGSQHNVHETLNTTKNSLGPWVNKGGQGAATTSIESEQSNTVYQKIPQLKNGAIDIISGQQKIEDRRGTLFGKSTENFAEDESQHRKSDQQSQTKIQKSSKDEPYKPLMNDDLQILMKEKKNTFISSANDADVYENEQVINLPVSRKNNSNKAPKDDFETAQLSSTYREHEPIVTKHPKVKKERPASSIESKRAQKFLTTKGQNPNASAQFQSAFKDRSRKEIFDASHMQDMKDMKSITSGDKVEMSMSREGIQVSAEGSDSNDQILRSSEEVKEDANQRMPPPVIVFDSINTKNLQVQENTYDDQYIISQKQSNQKDYQTMVQNELSTERILQLDAAQIDSLDFKQTCGAQQMLYSMLTQLYVQFCEALLARTTAETTQAMTNPIGRTPSRNLLQQRSNSLNRSQSPVGSAGKLKQNVFSTNYHCQRSFDSRPKTTEFALEQQEMRKKWIDEQRLIYGKVIEKPQAKKQKQIKFKLVEEPGPDASKGVVQREVDSYNRYKKKQERTKKRRQKFEYQNQLLGQCSFEEIILLSKINMLVQQQNMLVERAQNITMQDFLNMNTQKAKSEISMREQSQAIEAMKEQKATFERLNLSELMDTTHQPQAQRVSSRLTFHRYNQDLIQAKNFIDKAQEKLNTLNRSSNFSNQYFGQSQKELQRVRTRSATMPQIYYQEQTGQLMSNLALASNISNTMNDSMVNLREQLSQTNHTQNNSGNQLSSEQLLAGDYQSAFGEFKSKALQQKIHVMANPQILAQPTQNPNSLASTVNLHLINYFSGAQTSPLRERNQNINNYFQVENSPVIENARQLQSSNVSRTTDKMPNDFIIGHQQIINFESQAETTRQGPQGELRRQVSRRFASSKQSKSKETTTHNQANQQKDGHQEELLSEKQSSSNSISESPIDKYDLIYRNSNNENKSQTSFKIIETSQKMRYIKSQSMTKIGRSRKSSKSNSSNHSPLKQKLSKSPSAGDGFRKQRKQSAGLRSENII